MQQNRSIDSVMTSNPLFCQMVGCVAQKYDSRSQSPTIMKRNIHCFTNRSPHEKTFQDEVELVYSYQLIKKQDQSSSCGSSSANGNKSSSKKLKSATTASVLSNPITTNISKATVKKEGINDVIEKMSPKKSSKKKTVSFDLIEVREHPRILGDNPSAKKGPPLSLGWYEPADGRILRYSVDEYERRRFGKHRNDPSQMKKKSVEIISPTERQRMLLQDVGVTPSEIFEARKEVSKIRKSRRDHNILVNYDETAVVIEQCFDTVQRFLSYNGTSSEHEFRALMEQAERSKQQQQFLQQQQQKLNEEQQRRLPVGTIRSPSRIFHQHYQHLVQ